MNDRDQIKRALTAQVRRIINQAVARNEIEGPDALAIYMEIITTMIAQVRDPNERTEFVITLVRSLPQMVEIVHVDADPRGVADEANLLIAAAPDMLAALQQIADGLRDTGSTASQWMTKITKPAAYKIACAAIAKVMDGVDAAARPIIT